MTDQLGASTAGIPTARTTGDAHVHRRPSPLLAPVVMLAVFVIPMGISGTAIALPRIADDLGASTVLLQLVVNGFNVAFAVFGLVWGVIADRIGHAPTFRLGLGIVLVSAAATATAPDLVVLDVARFVAGVGSAAVLAGASAILSNSFSGRARGRVFAVFGTIIGLGLALGPTLSGVLINAIGWRAVFVVHGLLLVVALAGSLLLPRPAPPRIRAVGENTVDADVIAHNASAPSPARGGLLSDLRLLASPGFIALSLVPVAGAIGFVTLLTYLPVALSGIASLDAGQAGAMMLPLTIPVLLGPVVASRILAISPRVTSMAVIYAALGALVVGGLGMLALSPTAPLQIIVLPLVLIGFGFGLPLGLIDAEALASVPARLAGTAAGALNFIRIGSEALFVALFAWALSALISAQVPDARLAASVAAGHPGDGDVYTAAFRAVDAGLVVLVAVVAVAVVVLHRARMRSERSERAERSRRAEPLEGAARAHEWGERPLRPPAPGAGWP